MPLTISIVAEIDGAVVGHIAFSPVAIESIENVRGYILAPLGVKPEYQRRGVGSKLIEYGIRRLADMGVQIVFVYGDPAYYGRFGFSADAAGRFTAPYALQYPFGWQAVVLGECDIDGPPVKIACVASLSEPGYW